MALAMSQLDQLVRFESFQCFPYSSGSAAFRIIEVKQSGPSASGFGGGIRMGCAPPKQSQIQLDRNDPAAPTPIESKGRC